MKDAKWHRRHTSQGPPAIYSYYYMIHIIYYTILYFKSSVSRVTSVQPYEIIEDCCGTHLAHINTMCAVISEGKYCSRSGPNIWRGILPRVNI